MKQKKKRFVRSVLAATMTVAMSMSIVPFHAFGAESVKFPAVYTPDLVQPCTDEDLIEKKVSALVKAMTTEEKYTFMGGSGLGTNGDAGNLPGVPRLGVPEIRMYDGPTGIYYMTDSTNPPQEEMLAASWDEEMALLFGETVSKEAKAIGAGMMLSAQLDIQRIPQFSRTKDQMGADAYLLSRMGVNLVKGMQSEGGIAVLKHYVGYSDASINDVISEQALHERYMLPFEAAVKEGNALGIMSSYNQINGIYASANTYTQQDILRDLWGYKYFLITDWFGNHEFTMDKGTDIEMPNLDLNSAEAAAALVADGTYTQEEIDAMVDSAMTHILRAYGAAGYLTLVDFNSDGTLKEETGRTEKIAQIDSETAQAGLAKLQKSSNDAVQTIAENAGVLLKNEDSVLPLAKEDKVAVVGLTGMYLASGFGGERSYGAISAMTSPYEALSSILGKSNVKGAVYSDIIGTTIPNSNLYTSATGSEHGVVRTYGCAGTIGSEEGQQGQMFARGRIEPTAMGEHEIGEACSIDETIDYTTGTVKGSPNKTYLVANADKDSARAFPYAESPAYTIETYIQPSESGLFTLSYQSIGDTSKCYIYDTDGKTELASATGVFARQNSSWYASVIPSETGMNVENVDVELKSGQRYKVSIQVTAGTTNKDVQVNLSWITPSQKEANLKEALNAARQNDKVVIFAYSQNTSNNATTINDERIMMDLPADQEKMINDVAAAAHKAGNKVIVVLNNDGPVVMENWIDNVDGILEMYYPGQRGGVATANLLTGKVNPSGKLAYTIPKSSSDSVITHTPEAFASYMKVMDEKTNMQTTVYYEGINCDYKWFDERGIKPEFDFGYGLSYTTFEYSGISAKLAPEEGEKIGYDVTFTVKNTGDVTGSEVAQVYLGEAQVPEGIQTSKYALAGFEKVKDLEPGESRKVTIHVNERSLSYWNTGASEEEVNADGSKWTVATGKRTVYVGGSSDDLPLHSTINVK